MRLPDFVVDVLRDLGGLDPLPDVCECSCVKAVHEHWRRNVTTYCGPCGPAVCKAYRRRRSAPPDAELTNLAAVCADDCLIEAIRTGDLDKARTIADDELVALLAAYAATARGRHE